MMDFPDRVRSASLALEVHRHAHSMGDHLAYLVPSLVLMHT